MLKITTLIDNKSSENHNLDVEHGLAFLIETESAKLLFDFGASDLILANADEMNIDLSAVDIAVCSHAHYDHGNGFPSVIKKSPIKRLITGNGFFEPKYGFDGVKYTYLGINFDEKFLEDNKITHEVCDGVLEIAKGCYVVEGFERKNSFETIQPRFVKKTSDGFIKDDFSDEVCMVLESEKGLVVAVGCSHPGIINMLESISRRFDKPIYAVLGGTHLVEADEERILNSVDTMKRMGVEVLGLSHCSGDLVYKVIASDQDIINCGLCVGDVINF